VAGVELSLVHDASAVRQAAGLHELQGLLHTLGLQGVHTRRHAEQVTAGDAVNRGLEA